LKIHTIICFLFFLSGACALTYEVVWSRYLSLIIGSTGEAQAIIITVFMAGLALGYLLAGRFVKKTANFLMFFGFLEIFTGIYAVFFPDIYGLSGLVYSAAVQGLTPDAYFLKMIRVLFCCSGIILPTVAMGGTFPLLSAELSENNRRDYTQTISKLYFSNTAGAVTGAIAGGFFLMKIAGLSGTTFYAGLMNLLIGFSAIMLQKGKGLFGKKTFFQNPGETGKKILSEEEKFIPRWFLLLMIFITGLVSLLMEILFIRIFALALDSSTYSFTVIVSAYIAGIALGSLLLKKINLRHPCLTAGILLVSASFFIFVTIWMYPYLPFFFAKIRSSLKPSETTFYICHAFKFLTVFILTILPAISSGMILPLFTGILCRKKSSSEETGDAFFINTIGAVIGSAATLTLFIPAFGMKWSIISGMILLLCSGFSLIFFFSPHISKTIKFAVLSIGLVPVFPAVLNDWNILSLTSGEFRKEDVSAETFSQYLNRIQKIRLLFYEEDSYASVAVVEENEKKYLKIGGKTEASTGGDMITQKASAHVPLILHGNAGDILIIGLGSSATACSSALHGGNVDVVEISQAVSDAQKYFSDDQCMSNQKLKLIIEDAKSFLRITEKTYDVIINEPSNPWIAGMAGLFSVEFFTDIKKHLKQDGIFAQWFHLYEMDDDMLLCFLKTLNTVFPYMSIWEFHKNDILVIATINPINPDFEKMENIFKNDAVANDLGQVLIHDLPSLLSLQVLSEQRMAKILNLSDASLNTDDMPVLEFYSPFALFRKSVSILFSKVDERIVFNEENNILLNKYIQFRKLNLSNVQNMYVLHTVHPSAPDAFRYSMVETLAEESQPDFLIDLIHTLNREKRPDLVMVVWGSAISRFPDEENILLEYARYKIEETKNLCSFLICPDVSDAVAALEKCIELHGKLEEQCSKLLKDEM
jgi:spermidine synthase